MKFKSPDGGRYSFCLAPQLPSSYLDVFAKWGRDWIFWPNGRTYPLVGFLRDRGLMMAIIWGSAGLWVTILPPLRGRQVNLLNIDSAERLPPYEVLPREIYFNPGLRNGTERFFRQSDLCNNSTYLLLSVVVVVMVLYTKATAPPLFGHVTLVAFKGLTTLLRTNKRLLSKDDL